ncbi:MAG: galactokinase [Flaviramulus sp.]|nr:galactokinase [Flaviramulus sp.]NNC50324.1 galactokinase [Flaviramulus sp.]
MNTFLKANINNIFIDKFQCDPVLIFSPGRINIIGEHTDYNDGFVLPAAINKGIIAAISRSNSNISTVYAIDKAEMLEFSINNLKPYPEGSWQNYVLGVVNEIQNQGKTISNFNMVFGGNIPVGAGMSSSAALENSVVFGLNKIFTLGLTKKELVLISQKAEHNYVGVKCGVMDQYASMFGIENHALLLDCRTMESKQYEIDFKNHELLLINTNVKHSLSDSAYNDRRAVCESIASKLNVNALRDVTEVNLESIKNELSVEDYQKALYVIQENNRVVKASEAIERGDLKTLGKLIYESHFGLQNLYKVSCEELDFLVKQAKLNVQVLGARMIGGGFGGCAINLITKGAVESFKMSVLKEYKLKFNKDCTYYSFKLSDGTRVIN